MKGNFKYFTKFPVYRVNKIYLIVTTGQLSWLERRANNANVVGSTPTFYPNSFDMFMNIRFMDYVQKYNGNVMGSTPTRAKFLLYVQE